MGPTVALKLAPLFLLAGCMGASSAPAPSTPSPEVAAPEIAAIQTGAETPLPIAEPPPPPAPEPNRLSGLNPKQVQALMGPPSLVRRDGAVQVMLFETSACVFEIIFYEPTPDTHFRAEQINARSRTGTDTNVQTCLIGVLPSGQWLDANALGR